MSSAPDIYREDVNKTSAGQVRQRWLMPRAGSVCLTVLLILARPAAGQIPEVPGAQEKPAAEPVDPLGRHTPLGAITGFTAAVHREAYAEAQAYMQLTEQQRPNAEALARTLAALMDRYFTRPITELEASPAGERDDGLPPDEDRLVLSMPGGPADLVLKRVTDKQDGEIWLFSSETLARVPSLGRSLETSSWIQQHIPEGLVGRSIFGIPIIPALLWAGSLAFPFLLIWLVSTVLIRIVRLGVRNPVRRALLDSWSSGLRWLMILVLAIAVHLSLLPFLGFSLPFRLTDLRVSLVVAVLLLMVLAWRFLGMSFHRARDFSARRGNAGTQSLMILGERVTKVLVTMVAALVILRLAGVDTTTALTGLGIGGVVLALGAQKSVENLLGAVFLLTDKVIAVGDFCSVANRLGWIEDITLRSVRLRTLDQTLLSIPAGVLAQENIENFTTRSKMLVQTTLRLRYGTSAVQVHAVIDQIHELIVRDPDCEAEDARIRLVNFGLYAIELELFVYIKTSDILRFMAVREHLLLAVAGIIESAGSGFACPTDLLYLTAGADERGGAAGTSREPPLAETTRA
jgi:MscS family membrane protein